MTTALVTGASAGLGAAFARRLASEGCDLILVARTESTLAEVAGQLSRQYGVECEVLPADLSNIRQCAQVERRLADDNRPVEILVNNAGFGNLQQFTKSDVDDEERMLRVNVRAVMRLAHAALPGMLRRGHGDILNVSSVAGFLPNSGGSTYTASKAYVTSLADSLALDVAGTGVRVSAVCPGFIRSKFHERQGTDTSKIPRQLWLDADVVVATALRDHRRGKVISVPGATYKSVIAATRMIPRTLLRKISVAGRSKLL